MPTPMFLTVTVNTQGAIDGSCTIKGHENTMLIQALEHVIDIPKHHKQACRQVSACTVP